MKEYVMLVDETNTITGLEDKMEAHLQNKKHRAFSIFLFNDEQDMLLQCRAESKYHSAGLWSNACCSHPENDDCLEEANERLKYEMGIGCCLEEAGIFHYEAELGNGMYENEIDRIYTGVFNGVPIPNPLEVKGFRYASYEEIKADMGKFPGTYTVWFKLMIDYVYERYTRKQEKNMEKGG